MNCIRSDGCVATAKTGSRAAQLRTACVSHKLSRVAVVSKQAGGPSSRGSSVTCQAALDPQTFTTATYATLGLAGASFVGTFFVAPQFKDSFKEDLDWKAIYQSLQATGGAKQVDASEAYAKCKSGAAVMLDVRLGNKYEASHAVGSLSAPLYLPIQNWDVPSIIRRAGFAFFGIYGTELNTNFAAEVQQRVPKGKPVIVICETGGSMENKSGTKFGFQSRSLKAVFYLQRAGFKQVSYVKGGLPAWSREGLPMVEGPEDLAAVPGLREGNKNDDNDDQSSGGMGLFRKLRLPQLSFGQARR